MAVSLLLLLRWPTHDSDSELDLVMALMLAPFPLSALGALLARLPHWPLVGLVAPFAMLAIFCLQPAYDSWVPDEGLTFVLGAPVVVGFVLTALLCAWIGQTERPPEGGAG